MHYLDVVCDKTENNIVNRMLTAGKCIWILLAQETHVYNGFQLGNWFNHCLTKYSFYDE